MKTSDLTIAFTFWALFTLAVGIAGFFGGIVYEYKSLTPDFTCDLTANIEPLEIK